MRIDNSELKRLRSIASNMEAEFNIGKNGLTSTFIESVDKYLDKYEIVKIKSLKAADKDELEKVANEITEKLNAILVEVRGYTFVLYREKKK